MDEALSVTDEGRWAVEAQTISVNFEDPGLKHAGASRLRGVSVSRASYLHIILDTIPNATFLDDSIAPPYNPLNFQTLSLNCEVTSL